MNISGIQALPDSGSAISGATSQTYTVSSLTSDSFPLL